MRPTLRRGWPILLFTCACSAPRAPEPSLPSMPVEGEISRELPEQTGELLVEIDGLLRLWNQAKLDPRSTEEPRRRTMENELGRMVDERFEDLVHELEFGPPRNRQICAMALGFASEGDALGPLLAALDDERDGVVQNALLGLGILSDPATPLEPVLALLTKGDSGKTRNNAAFAVLRILTHHEAARATPGAADAVRSALHDPEPGVRVQAATSMRLLADPEALDDLADRVHDREPLVVTASLRAIGAIGDKVDTERGKAARILFEAWRNESGAARNQARLEMLRLSRGLDYGETEEDWRSWAYRLP